MTEVDVRNLKFRLSALKKVEKLSIFIFGGQRLERELSPQKRKKKPRKFRVEMFLFLFDSFVFHGMGG